MGWAWSDTASLDDADPPRDQGLYVIGAGTDIIYVGQSADLRSRITTHRRMLLSERRRSVRWVVTDDLSRAQLLEAECDLIASASLAAGAPPALQFGCSAERGSGPGAK